jgi:plastocyanin
MPSGRYLFVLIVMVWGMNSVPACAETIHVTIDQLIFSPVEIKAKVGDTVKWIDKGIVAHTATVGDDWDVMIGANKSACLVLTKASIVEYYCRFHPNMKGRITVTPGTK